MRLRTLLLHRLSEKDGDRLAIHLAASGGLQLAHCRLSPESDAPPIDDRLDVLLLHLENPDGDAELLQGICARHLELPVVVLAASADEDLAVRLLALGAQEVVTGEFDPVGVRRALRAAVERKRGEARLRRNQGALEALIEASPLAIVTVGSDWIVRRWNPAAEHLFGWSAKEVVGQPYPLVPEDKEDEYRQIVRRTLSGRPLVSLETRRRRKDGSLVAVGLSAAPAVRDARGEVVELIGIFEDITERKRLEQAVRTLAEGVRGPAGRNFFASLVELLAGTVGADVAFVGELAEDGETVTATAVWSDGAPGEGFTYPLRGTPCENIVGGRVGSHPERVAKLFPNDPLIPALGAEAYAGAPLLDAEGRPLGLLAVLFRHPLSEPELVESLLAIYASRAASEIERSRSEEALRASEERYRLVSLATNDAVWDWDLATDRVEWSEGIRTLFGYDLQEIGPTIAWWTDHVHAEDRERVMAGLQAMLERGERAWSDEYRFRRKDGSWADVQDRGYVIHVSGGQPSRMLGAMLDVSERRQAERALRRSEARHRALVEQIPAIVYTAFPEEPGGTAYMNPQVEATLGFTPEELISDPSLWRERLHPEDRERVREEFRDLARGARGPSLQTEYRMVARDGRVVWLRDHAALVWDEARQARFLQGVMLDVTARKRAEEELARSRRYFRALIENTSDLVSVVEADGTIRYQSPAAERLLGYRPEERIGQGVFDLVHPQDLPRVRETFTELVASPRATRSTEVRLRHKQGGWRSFEIEGHNLLAEPAVAGVVLAARDVTFRQELEAQFRQAQKMEAIGRLAGGVAHDFNNLLTAISGYTQLAGQTIPAEMEPTRLHLDQVQKAAGRAADLTRQLLAFSRQQVLQPRVLQLNDTVAELEKMLRRLIGEDIELTLDLAPGLELVRADPGQLDQVILNLAVNARDAMPRGGKLELTTRNTVLGEEVLASRPYVEPGTYVNLAVRDTGVGMDEATQSRIFEPFFTTKERGKGTGLGLSTVYGIVKQAGGYIWVESTPDQGSTFHLFFRPTKAESAGPPTLRPPEPAAPEAGTILVVEDEDAVRHLVEVVLGQRGYRVLLAQDGKEALAVCQARSREIDLVLTDVVMPEMSGRELASRIAEVAPAARVLFMSGYTDDAALRQHVLEPGAPFLQKPFTPATLAAKVREVLEAE
jgi:PAS domain S-box-containing protein